MNDFIIELKKLNPKCDIKISADSNVYISIDPRLLVLPKGIMLFQDNGSYYFSGSLLSRMHIRPMSSFSLNEKDYFPEVVFESASFENIYELTCLNPRNLILKYLKKISEISPIIYVNRYFDMGTLKYLVYEGLKQEQKFNKITINRVYQKELYDYIKHVSNTDVYRNPLDIQKGWESFQSWHITGGSRPDETTLTHRFYLSISPDKVHLVAKKLLEKYLESGKPFYFKVAEGRATKDSIVIYTSHGTFNTTLDILRNLEPFMNSIQSDLGSSHPLTYPLTPWLGYASEIMDGRTSYTDLISEAISIALKEELNFYAKIHKNDTLIHGMTGTNFFGNADVNEKIKRAQLAMKDIMQDNNAINRLIYNIMIQIQKENINIENIYYDNDVVSDLMNYRESVHNKYYQRGFISISIIIIFTILLGIMLAIIFI